jgi:hypothetical protein
MQAILLLILITISFQFIEIERIKQRILPSFSTLNFNHKKSIEEKD